MIVEMNQEKLEKRRNELIDGNLDDMMRRFSLPYHQREIYRVYFTGLFDQAEILGQMRRVYIEYRKYQGLEVD